MNENAHVARVKDKRGSVTVVTVLFLVLLFAFAAFAVDVGYMMVRRNELQNIADTAALAATGELGAQYVGIGSLPEQLNYIPPRDPLLAKAQEVAAVTGVGGVTISGADLQLGIWNPYGRTLTAAATGPTAIRVTVHKDGVENGPFSTLLAGVLGVGSFNVSAVATASLTSVSALPEDALPLPVGISLHWFADKEYCDKPITFSPTQDSCAGWNVYTQDVAADSKLRTILQGLNAGTYHSPETIAGSTAYTFIGGDLSNPTFDAMRAYFDTNRVKNDGVVDKDTDPNTWTTTVPVYNWPDCSNPNPRDGPIMIVGFSTVVITQVVGAPSKEIDAKVVCDNIIAGPGGNPLGFGLFGNTPHLVQ